MAVSTQLKVSRPVIYATLIGAVAATYLFITQPDTSTATVHTTRTATRTVAAADDNGITPADLKAHFPRYKAGSRDPFVSEVATGGMQGQGLDKADSHGNWQLTGINIVNGAPSAVVENSGTGDSAFLAEGDHWNGLRVVRIGDDSIIFQNAFGQQTTLTFAAPPADNPNAPINPQVPSLSQVTPLPAIPSPDQTQAAANVQPQDQSQDQTQQPSGRRRGRRNRFGGGGGYNSGQDESSN